MPSLQSLTEVDRRLVATWAADCAERVLPLFETEAPEDERPREAITRLRAYARGELDTAYATKAVGLAAPDHPDAVAEEIAWQIANMSVQARKALQQLPPLGEDSAGPLGAGLLTSGILGSTIRRIQSAIGVLES